MPEPRELVEADLAEYVEGESWPDPSPDDAEAPSPPEDHAAAAGILRRLKRLAHEAAQINEVADFEVARIESWRRDRLGIVSRDVAWGERALDTFMRRHGLATRARSLALPGGTLKLAKATEKVEVVDADAFLAWCVTQADVDEGSLPGRVIRLVRPDLVRVTIEPAKTALKALVKGKYAPVEGTDLESALLSLPGGEMVPGVEIRRGREDRFNLVLGED